MQNEEQDPPGDLGDAVMTVLSLKVVTDTHQQQQPKPGDWATTHIMEIL